MKMYVLSRLLFLLNVLVLGFSFSLKNINGNRLTSSSKLHMSLWIPKSPSWDARTGMYMADPDTPPEVNPTRRDPDEPGKVIIIIIIIYLYLLSYMTIRT